jgi:predicted RNase H-like nuclease (RuvC/YqgF family)
MNPTRKEVERLKQGSQECAYCRGTCEDPHQWWVICRFCKGRQAAEIVRLKWNVESFRDVRRIHIDNENHKDKVIERQKEEIERLKAELANQTRYKETALRQLDTIDKHLPEWKGTGKGRVTVIDEQAAVVEAARKLQRATIKNYGKACQIMDKALAKLDGGSDE